MGAVSRRQHVNPRLASALRESAIAGDEDGSGTAGAVEDRAVAFSVARHGRVPPAQHARYARIRYGAFGEMI